jgi:hypothetical protein
MTITPITNNPIEGSFMSRILLRTRSALWRLAVNDDERAHHAFVTTCRGFVPRR